MWNKERCCAGKQPHRFLTSELIKNIIRVILHVFLNVVKNPSIQSLKITFILCNVFQGFFTWEDSSIIFILFSFNFDHSLSCSLSDCFCFIIYVSDSENSIWLHFLIHATTKKKWIWKTKVTSGRWHTFNVTKIYILLICKCEKVWPPADICLCRSWVTALGRMFQNHKLLMCFL